MSEPTPPNQTVQSRLWKYLQLRNSGYFPQLVEGAAAIAGARYNDDLRRQVMANADLLDILVVPIVNGVPKDIDSVLEQMIVEGDDLDEAIHEAISHIGEDYLAEEGATYGELWRQPLGAHDAYPKRWRVTHNGKIWESLVPANVWEPGVSGWREVPNVDPGGGGTQAPEWVQPTGAHDTYKVGDRVTFNGQVYESTVANNSWSPADYGWQLVP